jgi:hypothetical protein
MFSPLDKVCVLPPRSMAERVVDMYEKVGQSCPTRKTPGTQIGSTQPATHNV